MIWCTNLRQRSTLPRRRVLYLRHARIYQKRTALKLTARQRSQMLSESLLPASSGGADAQLLQSVQRKLEVSMSCSTLARRKYCMGSFIPLKFSELFPDRTYCRWQVDSTKIVCGKRLRLLLQYVASAGVMVKLTISQLYNADLRETRGVFHLNAIRVPTPQNAALLRTGIPGVGHNFIEFQPHAHAQSIELIGGYLPHCTDLDSLSCSGFYHHGNSPPRAILPESLHV